MAIPALIDAIERDAGKTDAHSQAKLARNLFLLRSQTDALTEAATTGGGQVVIVAPPKASTGELHHGDIDAAWDKVLADPDFSQNTTPEQLFALAEKLGVVREITAHGDFGTPDHPTVDGADFSDYDAASNGGSDGPNGTGSFKVWKDGVLVATGQLKAGEGLTEVALANGVDLSD